jgi:hypothetical protein
MVGGHTMGHVLSGHVMSTSLCGLRSLQQALLSRGGTRVVITSVKSLEQRLCGGE